MTKCWEKCGDCGSTDMRWSRYPSPRGWRVKARCKGCGASCGFVPHKMVPDLDALPIETQEMHRVEQCPSCSAQAVLEEHHLAPVAVFGFETAERFPKIRLCAKCHADWHKRMRNAGFDAAMERMVRGFHESGDHEVAAALKRAHAAIREWRSGDVFADMTAVTKALGDALDRMERDR